MCIPFMVILQYNLYIFRIHLWTVFYSKPCYNELCYKELVVYYFSEKIQLGMKCRLTFSEEKKKKDQNVVCCYYDKHFKG